MVCKAEKISSKKKAARTGDRAFFLADSKAQRAGVTERFRNTPFTEALAQEAKSGLAPEVIGKAVWRALTVTRPRVRFAIVPKRFMNWTIPQLMPMRILDKLVAQFFGIKRRNQ